MTRSIDAEKGPAWPKIVDLACDLATNDFNMAHIPPLGIGQYEVRAVAGEKYLAWSNVNRDTDAQNNWYHDVYIVTIGDRVRGAKRLGTGFGYASPEKALSAAQPHRFEVGNEQIVILFIRDNGVDTRGGLKLEINRVS